MPVLGKCLQKRVPGDKISLAGRIEELLHCLELTHAGVRIDHHGCRGHVPDRAGHSIKQLFGIAEIAVLHIRLDHPVPGEEIGLLDRVEDEAGVADGATFAVRLDEEIGKESIACVWAVEDLRVEAIGLGGIPGISASSQALGERWNVRDVVISNGFLELTLTNPGGDVTRISYGGITDLLEWRNKETNRGYWNLVWSLPDGGDKFDVISGTKFTVVSNTEDMVELSFYRPYDSTETMVPLNIDKRFVVLRGRSGFYTYAIFDRPYGWSDFNLNVVRVAWKLGQDNFDFMAISDTKQRVMPYPQDRYPQNSETLAYKEAVILVNPKNPNLKGEVDDKYQYSGENRSTKVHGWISFDPLVGFWMITPSYEFKTGGPLKQNLLSHTGPTCLSVFLGSHYGGITLCPKFRDGEAWKKVFGPVFVYLNSSSTDHRSLWEDAKLQAEAEIDAWPYSWPGSSDFTLAAERGHVSGEFYVFDSFLSSKLLPAAFAWIGLAPPGDAGSWQEDSKGYQFWTQADKFGNFEISNVLPGTYDLYGWVPGVIGDYKKQGDSITISQGGSYDLGSLVYKPPRNGPTLWEIGFPDRSAAGFFVPSPDSKYVSKLFVYQERFRQYGLWTRYSEIYSSQDLVYTVGSSQWPKDWFFIHGVRVKSDGSFEPTTWEIKFWLDLAIKDESYTLRIAIAGSHYGNIKVYVNSLSSSPCFVTGMFGRDNAIARHGIHGLYRLYSVDINGGLLKRGDNSIYLTQANSRSPFVGVLYDHIRFEAPCCEIIEEASSSL
ncbi:probable rhamnogalacturonate lyase B [Selaginella moellendorffii]|uniref:probable rhamnogalacturonate lyase B n=1 Tax=Selaginella moellendorffii TaxID=88036 RepID=UPI000D1C919C|nr:probable rhamnogalacturonate lyase B [Selaginella moellendorffii]|eukprot:XP_024533891.1 probable rhamnogalacturonate lyase B [Selaginella moellendorffii]